MFTIRALSRNKLSAPAANCGQRGWQGISTAVVMVWHCGCSLPHGYTAHQGEGVFCPQGFRCKWTAHAFTQALVCNAAFSHSLYQPSHCGQRMPAYTGKLLIGPSSAAMVTWLATNVGSSSIYILDLAQPSQVWTRGDPRVYDLCAPPQPPCVRPLRTATSHTSGHKHPPYPPCSVRRAHMWPTHARSGERTLVQSGPTLQQQMTNQHIRYTSAVCHQMHSTSLCFQQTLTLPKVPRTCADRCVMSHCSITATCLVGAAIG